MERELREIYDFGKLNIITERSKLPKYALAKLSYSFAKADSKNANHRTYSESILSREIDRKNEELRTQKIPGMLNHPISGVTELDRIAHVLNSVSYDRTTKLAGAESYVLDTSRGRDFMTMMDAELKMGASMRGFGNVKNGYVQSDWKLDTLDFVLHPSFGSNATIDQSNIIESANSIFDEKENRGKNMNEKMMGLSQDYVDEMMMACYGIYLKEQNYKGTFEDFEKENRTLVLASILIEEGKCLDHREALEHLKKFGEIEKIPTAPKRKKVTPSEIFLEARMSGIDPQIYAQKMNASLEPVSDLSQGEIIAVLSEAREAGVDISNEKERKRVLEIRRKQKAIKVLSEDERAAIVAKRTGSTKEFVKEIWKIEEKKKAKAGHYSLLVRERILAGFGSEIRPESRKISKKIMEGE